MIALRALFQDIIENEDIKLDDMFIASLVHDLIKVSIFLHTYFRKRYRRNRCKKIYIYVSFSCYLGYAVHSRVICTSLSW